MLGALEASKVGTADRWHVGIMSKDEIAFFWKEVNDALDETQELWADYYSKVDIIDALSKDEMYLLAAAKDEVIHLLTLCAFNDFPAGRRLTCFWMYGEGLEEAAKLIDKRLEEFALITNAKYIDGYGRRGYERILRPYGYKFQRVHVARLVGIGARH